MKPKLLFPTHAAALLATLLSFACLAPSAPAQLTTVKFQNDYSPGGYRGMEDTWLFQAYPSNSKGGSDVLNCGSWLSSTKWRTLIRANVTSLANSYSSIGAARLKLKVSQVNAQGGAWTNQTFYLYRISDANRAWSAGTSGDSPQQGAACWGWNAYSTVIDPTTGQPGGTPWAGSTGCGASGVDYVATPVATAVLSSSITAGTVVTFNFNDISHLPGWIANAGANAGYLLIAPGLESNQQQNLVFFSSEAQNLADRPSLELDIAGYTPPAGSHISYNLPYAGRVSINIYDSQGHVIRELTHADPELGGAQDLIWNLADAQGARVPDGNYTWKLLETPSALTAKYILQLGTNTNPDWDAFTGNDEGVRGLAVDSSGVYLSGAVSEGDHLVLKQDQNGGRLWTYHSWVEVWQGGQSMAVNNGTLYQMQENGRISLFDAASGNYLGTWDTAYAPEDHNGLPWGSRYEIAASNGRLIVSFPARNAVRWLSASTGAVLQEVAVPNPQGIALDAAGNAYVVSNNQVVKLPSGAASAATFINSNLVKPWRIAVDPSSGDVLVFDAGTSQQVKRFSSGGALKAAYGRSGGRQQGLYNGGDFQMAMALAAAPDGSFWVTESYSMPRRTAHFAANGVLIKEFYGSQTYNVDCAVDPADPTLVWMNAGNGGALQLKVDYTNKSWSVRATYAMTTIGFPNGDSIAGPALSRAWGGSEDFAHVLHRNGNTYLLLDTYGPQMQLVDEANRRLVPMVCSGNVGDLPANLRPSAQGLQRYIWTDLNGDGLATSDELTFDSRSLRNTSWSGGNGSIGSDFVYYFNLYNISSNPPWPTTRPGRLAPRGWTPGGAPIYNWADLDWSGDPLPGNFAYVAPYSCITDDAGNLYGAYNLDITYNIGGPGGGNGFWSNRAGDTKLVKWGPDRKLQWSVGRQSRTGGADQGEMRYLWRITGVTHGCTVTQDVENGLVHVWDQDGLWVGRCLDQQAADGLPGDAYSSGTEDWGGDLYTDPNTGKVYFYIAGGGGDRVYEMTGWDNWVHQSGQVAVGASASAPFARNFSDIGSPGSNGSVSYNASSATWTVSGGGSDIWGTSDQFGFTSEATAGDETLIAKVTSLTNTDAWAKAGVMFRDSAAAGSMFVDVVATAGNGVSMQWRASTGGQCGYLQVSPLAAPTASNPVWVKLVRSGSTYTGFYGSDGSNWTLIGTVNVSFTNSSYLAGLAVTSHNNGALNVATFTDVTVSGSGVGLKGDYFANMALSGGATLTRNDAAVNFNWNGGSPAAGVPASQFSVRWTGQIQAPLTGSYTFNTISDDGVRLWVNGSQIINNWTDHAPTSNTSAAVNLTAAQKYDIQLEFYQNTGGDIIQLSWTPPGGAQQMIPQSQLFLSSGPNAAAWYRLSPRHAPNESLDVSGASQANGAGIDIWTWLSAPQEEWQFQPTDSGYYRLTPRHATSKCLDVNGGGTGNGTGTIIWDWTGGANQQWSLTPTDSGYYRLTPRHATGQCLDVSGVGTADGTPVWIWQYVSGANQQWRFDQQP